MDRWALVIWDGENNRREVLTLGELEFSMGHWQMMETLDSVINNCYKYHGIIADKTKWEHDRGPVEAWSSVCELPGEVPEHARVINLAYSLLMGKVRPRDLIRNLPMRDLVDVTVLKRVRLVQLQMMADADRVNVVYPTKMKMANKDLGEDDSEGVMIVDGGQSGKYSVMKHDGTKVTLGGLDNADQLSN